MKVYISCDMEGCTGTAYRAQMSPNPSAPGAYARAQRFLTDDVKAAIEGILAVDPEAEIWFNDAHGRSMNVFFEEFPKNVKAVVGSAEVMDEVLGLDGSFDALVCIGAHANNMTEDAVLSHVWDVSEVKFNGKSLSETGLSSALAGFYGVPLVAISGCEASVKAIRKEISPDLPAAVVKKGMGRYGAVCENPSVTRVLIKEAVIEGLNKRDEMPLYEFSNPVTVDIVHKDHFNAYAQTFFVPEDERVSVLQTRFVANDARDAYIKFLARDKLSKARHN